MSSTRKARPFPASTRMDLVHASHPAEFAAYAIRDAEVSVTYLRRVAEFAESWGLTKMPPTVASIATTRLRNDASHLLPGILGRDLTQQGRIGDPIAEARAIQSLAADAYHGGRNEAFVHGIFTATPERPFVDYDLQGLLHDGDGRFPDTGLGSDRAHDGPVTPCRPRRPDYRQRRLRVPRRHAISLPAGQHRRRRPGLPAVRAAPR